MWRLRVSTIALLLLLTTPCLARRGGRRRGTRGGRSKCPSGCTRCTNSTSCTACYAGFALTPESLCEKCGDACKSCALAGPGGCDVCNTGYTLSAITAQCQRCAENCMKCDQAGPGMCDDCGPRRMLETRLEVHGEVHECHACGHGCKSCTHEDGCLVCDAFYVLLPDHTDCALSWLRVGVVIGVFLLVVCGGCFLCTYLADEEDVDHHRPVRRKKHDSVEVVNSQDAMQGKAHLRRRVNPDSPTPSPPAVRASSSKSYPLLPGYSGIEIVESHSFEGRT